MVDPCHPAEFLQSLCKIDPMNLFMGIDYVPVCGATEAVKAILVQVAARGLFVVKGAKNGKLPSIFVQAVIREPEILWNRKSPF
jgi:hypothetical protein